jgi:rod shape-determining protein MreC
VVVYRRSQRRSVLVLLVLTSITLVTLDLRGDGGGMLGSVRGAVRDLFAPVEVAADTVVSPLGRFVDGITQAGGLRAENRRLRRRLERVEGELARVRGLDRENTVLRTLLDLRFAEDVPGVVGRVVSFAPTNFEWSITIDRGSADGVKLEMPVVSGQGLVGRIVEVSRTRSKALLITDPRISVGIRLAGSGETGVTKGLPGKSVLEVDLVDPDVTIGSDELVVTSGLQQSRYPPGIPIGTVVSVSTRPGSLQKDVRVRPLADLEQIEYVEVLLWSPPAAPDDSADDSADDRPTDAPVTAR